MGKKTQQWLLLLLCLSGLVHCSATTVFWTAEMRLTYSDSNNNTVDTSCECGLFGRDSPVKLASGIVTLPVGDPLGCGSGDIYNRSSSSLPWIALVKRGNCTFAEKINAAKRQGAAAVVVYNHDSSGNNTTLMSHMETGDIVAVMVGNIKGMEIVTLLKYGTDVLLTISQGRAHGLWGDTYWLYFLSIAFFIVTAASVAYFVFISANRLYNLSLNRRNEKRLKSEAKKAIRRLQVRTLKQGDEETTSDSLMCAVCIESYKAGDVMTVLTCDHIFHKNCIEPWLLEKRTCPMCKCDILKALGVEEDRKDSIIAESPPEVSVVTVVGGDAMYEVPLTDPGSSSDPESHQHRYDNRAFEADLDAVRG
ncbi:E3 ubiquitin-protein ligase RNF128a [Pholidichthys leucotaenia]